MARLVKEGINQFSMSTDFDSDPRIQQISYNLGSSKVLSVLIKVLNKIFREKGYYLKWDTEASFNFSLLLNTKEQKIDQIVKRAVELGFFDEELFESEGVLTSQEIQKRYRSATRHRKNQPTERPYWLLPTPV
jgi:glutamine synthetase type III